MTDDLQPEDSRGNLGLGHRVTRGLTWTVVHTWGGQVLSLLVFVILARLLTPDEFGLVALAMVFVALAQLIVDQGLGDALIQRIEIGPDHVDSAFWVAVVTGAVLTLVGVLVAIPISIALREPELIPILQVLSVTFLLSAFSSIPIALLTRALEFRLLAIRTLLAIVGGGVVGVTLALTGFGAWALVGQQVAAAVLSAAMLWAVTPWRPRLHASRRAVGELFPFGVRVMGSDILGFVSRNADNLLVGIFLGTVPLGIYSVGYRILDTSQRLLINVARKVTFPALSRLQHDADRLERAYVRILRQASVVILPGYVGLALVAPELTVTLFGTRWAESGPVAAVLFLSGPVLALQAFSGSLLYALGRADVVLRFRVITAVANVTGFVLALPLGIVAVAAAFTIRGYLLLPLLLRWTSRSAGVRAADHATATRAAMLATAVMAGVVLGVKLLAVDRIESGTLLGAEILAGAVAFAAALWLADRSLMIETWTVARATLPRRRASGAIGDGRHAVADREPPNHEA